MTDLEKIYECLIDKSYQNKAQFEIVLSDIGDKELAVGFLFDLLLKHASYEADKQTMLELIAETLGEMTPREYIKKCHDCFLERIKEINTESMEGNRFVMDALATLLSAMDSEDNIIGSTESFEKVVSECKSKDHLKRLKSHLLEAEFYEVIGIVDKYL